jgi:hypothetical protein
MYNTTEFKMTKLLGSVENLMKWLNFIFTAKLFIKQKNSSIMAETNYNNNIGTTGLIKQNLKFNSMFK